MKKKKQGIIFLIFLIVSLIFNYMAIGISHGLDSYCTMCKGYEDTAIWFIQNGRVFSYLFYMLFDLIKLPFDYLRSFSVIVSNLILSINIMILYNQIMIHYKDKSKIWNVLVLGLLFLIYYTPFAPSILVLDERFVINLGILFLTLASIYILKNGINNYLIGLLFSVLGFSCYQGLSSYLFIPLFILMIVDKKYRNNINEYMKKTMMAISIYGFSFLGNLLIIKIVGIATEMEISKLGNLSIITNIKLIISELIPNSFRYLYGYVNIKLYYIVLLIVLIIAIVYIVRNLNKFNNIMLLILLIGSAMFASFIPNIFMNSDSNYIEARMLLTISIIPVLICLYIVLSFKIDLKMMGVISLFGCFFLFIAFNSVYQNMKVDKMRYKSDMEYLDLVVDAVNEYEINNLKYVDMVYYGKDMDVAYYYSFGRNTDTNIRLMAIDWAVECALSYKLGRSLEFDRISDEKYQELFSNRNYDEFNEEQIVFENNKLYLLGY